LYNIEYLRKNHAPICLSIEKKKIGEPSNRGHVHIYVLTRIIKKVIQSMSTPELIAAINIIYDISGY